MDQASVFRAVSDPTRRAILDRLSRGEHTAGQLQQGFEMSAPAVSQHLRVLREAGLVRQRKDGRQRVYRLQAERLREVFDWVSRYERFWEERLDRLQQILDQQQEG